MGKFDADFTFTDFLLEEVELVMPTRAENIEEFKTSIYPNPATNKLYINNLDEFTEYSISNLNGSILKKDKLNSFVNTINTNFLPSGMYFILLRSNNKTYSEKIIKQY